MILGNTKICVYQFIFYQDEINDTKITQYCIIYGIGLCIKLNSYVAHMFYKLSFSHNIAVPISVNKNIY